MTELTDAQVNELCARFVGPWKGGKVRAAPDYLHSPEAADELMAAINVSEYGLFLSCGESRKWRATIGDIEGDVESMASDWKEALARAVAQMQKEKEAE